MGDTTPFNTQQPSQTQQNKTIAKQSTANYEYRQSGDLKSEGVDSEELVEKKKENQINNLKPQVVH